MSMKSFLLYLSVPLFGIGVALGIVELGFRLVLPASPPTAPAWNDRPAFYFAAPTVPSMQDFPYQIPKPPSTFRIAVVGDSFTFAPYMQLTDTFPKKLEQLLTVNRAPLRAEVINYGVPAYSTSHEVSVVQRAIDEGADLVILQITLNDPEVKAHRPTGILEDAHDRFAPKQPKGAIAWLARHWRTFGFALTRFYNSLSHQAYIDYFNDLYDNPRSWKPFTQAMTSLSRTSQDRKVPLVAVVFPLFGIAMNSQYPFYPIHEKVNSLLTSLNVAHIDLSSIYTGIPLERLQVIPGVDRHPNEIAHRMAAERLYLWLEEQELLPKELLIQDRFATRLGTQDQRRWTPVQP